MTLISFRYWENFVDRDIGAIPIQAFKTSLRLGRCKTYIFASLWKIGLTLAFAYILVPNMTSMHDLFNNIGNETAFDNRSNRGLMDLDYMYNGDSPSNKLNSTFASDFPDYQLEPVEERRPRLGPRIRRDVNDSDELPQLDDKNNMEGEKNDVTNPLGGPGDGERKRKRKKKTRVRKPRPPKPPVAVRPNEYNYNTYDYDYISDFLGNHKVDKVLYRFLPLIVQALSGAICYYFARVACKLCMQGFSFSFPLTMITPVTAAIFCYLCHLQDWTRVTLPDLEIGFWKCSETYENDSFHWQVRI